MATIERIYLYEGKRYTHSEMAAVVKGLRDCGLCWRHEAALKMVEGKRILDVGCSVGITTRCIAERGHEAVGIDILGSVIDIAKDFSGAEGADYRHGDLFDLGFKDGEFDSILFLETIEHVHNPLLYLREFYRILKPGGHLILSTPNAVSYLNILYQLPIFSRKKQQSFAESLQQERRDTGTQLDHIFSWDFRTLLRYLVRNGFEYGKHEFVGAPPLNVKIGSLSVPVMGTSELKFLAPVLRPYLTTLIVKVKKPEAAAERPCFKKEDRV